MRPSLLISPLALSTTIHAMEFINPTPFAFGSESDFSLNAVYVIGSTVNIQWTPGPLENTTALTMYQLNGTQFLQPFEYLTQNGAPNITSFSWTVQTTKDLTLSNMFFLCIFLQGSSNAAANSHYFNITRKETGKLTTTASSTSVVSSTSSPASAFTSNTATSSGSDGLSTAAKAGLAVGICAAVILGVSAGWCIFGRRKKEDVAVPVVSAGQGDWNGQEKWYPQVHQSQVHQSQVHQPQVHQLSGESTAVPSFYELQDSQR